MDVLGKTAVVTGAGKGIGRAIATMLVEKGARVALVARRAHVLEELQSEIDPARTSSLVVPADVADEAQVSELFARIHRSPSTAVKGAKTSTLDRSGLPPITTASPTDVKLARPSRLVRLALPGHSHVSGQSE